MNIATWYFDFVSPFAYLQNLRLNEFSSHIKIDRKPLLFAGLLKHWGSKGPARITSQTSFYISTRSVDGRPPGYSTSLSGPPPFQPNSSASSVHRCRL